MTFSLAKQQVCRYTYSWGLNLILAEPFQLWWVEVCGLNNSNSIEVCGILK